jgi:hypothetical protein
MSKLTKGHKQVKCYADGGKIEPTYGRALLAKVGIGDGYGNSKNPPKPKKPREMNVGNATSEFGNVMAKRKKMLDET